MFNGRLVCGDSIYLVKMDLFRRTLTCITPVSKINEAPADKFHTGELVLQRSELNLKPNSNQSETYLSSMECFFFSEHPGNGVANRSASNEIYFSRELFIGW